MIYSKDIEERINRYFSDSERVKKILENTTVPANELERVIRCILYLSDGEYEAIDYWVRVSNTDRRDLYYFAEYDERDVRRWNFNFPFDGQIEYQFHNA